MAEKCPTCGGAVEIGGDGPTHYYVPTAEADVAELTALLRRLVGPKESACVIVAVEGGTPYCSSHRYEAPCPVGAARARLERDN